jgi:heme/copper-type cytochrome/quinol oxidase subunit 4
MTAKVNERRRLKRQNEKYAKWKKYYFIGFIAGLILMIFQIFLFRKTIIPIWIPLTIILTIGTVTFIFNRTHFNRTNNSSGWFFSLLQNICSWGFMFCYLFMSMNYYFADAEQLTSRFEIKSKSSMSGARGYRNERKPLVTIDYFGLEKVLVFSYNDTHKIDKATKVSLTVRKGLLGFDILEHYNTVDNDSW